MLTNTTKETEYSQSSINLPAAEVDREIEDAQRRVCEFLGIDLCVLWQWTHDTPRYITMTHLYRPLGGPPPLQRMDAQEMAPWCWPQIMGGKIIAVDSMDSLPPEAARDKEVWLHYGIKSALAFPLSAAGQILGAVSFNAVREERPWQKEIVNRLTLVAQVFANALARKVADEALRESMAENERLRERLQAESEYLKAEIKVTAAHGEIIGRSRAIRQVLSQVEQVAPTDSSVLIHGETGTGKELIAQEIHRLSPRREHLMVKVNCAALPSALVESELFGGVLQSSFKVDITRRLKFSQTINFFLLKEAAGLYSHHAASRLEFEIKRHLDLNVSVVWDYLQNPQPESNGFIPEHSDLRLNVGVGVKF